MTHTATSCSTLRRIDRRTALVFACVVACASVACSNSKAGSTETTADGGSPDILLEGSVTDEMQVAFESAIEQKAPVKDTERGPLLNGPAEGSVLDPASPPTFRWKVTASNDRTDVGGGVPSRLATFLRDGLWGGLWGEGVAHAHGTPTTGSVTFLVFSFPGDDKAIRVLTSRNEFTPTAEQLQKLAKSGQDVTLTLTGFVADENRVSDGPFVGSTNRFTVAR
ncbi:MAG: hypothetical protein U0169_21425 [Polyangiaceae bacterium]